MGSDRRFTLVLAGWVALLGAALAASVGAFMLPGLGAGRIVALLGVAGATAGLWLHVRQTNRTVARFIEALRFGDSATRFGLERGAGFGELGQALDAAMARAHARQEAMTGELRFLEALVDDMPIALLTVDAEGQVTPANKAARRLFRDVEGARAEDYARYSATLARQLAEGGSGETMLLIALDGMPQNVLVRQASLDRLGRRTSVVTVQPVQGMLNAVEAAAQTDLVRVLTHEILNSLTPVTSLAETAAGLLQAPDLAAEPRIADARAAVVALARRASGLSHFIEAYRAIARSPEVRRQRFLARPWAEELVRIFAAEAAEVPIMLIVEPRDLPVDADPDLLAQVVINLLRNARQAMEGHTDAPHITLRLKPYGQAVLLEVEDCGPGVPPALRHDIFLPFFTTRANGTGVGLNLARQIAIAHDGTIEVRDAAEGGALIRLALPRT